MNNTQHLEPIDNRRISNREIATKPIQPDELSHLFDIPELHEIRAYVAGVFAVIQEPIEDDWHELKLSTGNYADINFFTVNEFSNWITEVADAYRVIVDPNTGDRTTDTDEWVRIELKSTTKARSAQ